MTKFGNLKSGDILNGEFLDGSQRRALKFKMPIELRAPEHNDQIERFLSQVADAAKEAAHMITEETPASILKIIEEMETAAKKLQQAMQPLSGESDAFDVLESHFNYFTFKELPDGSPPLSDLMESLYIDLSSVRKGCKYAASKITPDRSIQPKKSAARFMTEKVTRSYIGEFGCKPPQASWFAQFMKIAGKYAGVACGSGVVSEVVSSFKD